MGVVQSNGEQRLEQQGGRACSMCICRGVALACDAQSCKA